MVAGSFGTLPLMTTLPRSSITQTAVSCAAIYRNVPAANGGARVERHLIRFHLVPHPIIGNHIAQSDPFSFEPGSIPRLVTS